MSDLPQLRMHHPLTTVPTPRPLPLGFLLQEATDADAEGIAHVLAAAFETPWTPESVRRELLDHPGVPVTFLIERDGEPVATASYQEKPEPDPNGGWLHWVGVHPSARGAGLGEIVSARVLTEAAQRNRSGVWLTTDDFRLPAIRTYLRLGFAPDPWHETHPERWDRILREFDEQRTAALQGGELLKQSPHQ